MLARTALVMLGGIMPGLPLAPVAAEAREPVAIIEDSRAPSLPLLAMDYLDYGTRFALTPQEELVIGYFASCRREVIRGGQVTVGRDGSVVDDGEMISSLVPCDGGRLLLAEDEAREGGGVVVREQDGPIAPEAAQLTLHATAAVFRFAIPPGVLRLQRLDLQDAPAREFPVQGVVLDLRAAGTVLVPGAVYRAETGHAALVIAVDPNADEVDAAVPLLQRLIRM